MNISNNNATMIKRFDSFVCIYFDRECDRNKMFDDLEKYRIEFGDFKINHPKKKLVNGVIKCVDGDGYFIKFYCNTCLGGIDLDKPSIEGDLDCGNSIILPKNINDKIYSFLNDSKYVHHDRYIYWSQNQYYVRKFVNSEYYQNLNMDKDSFLFELNEWRIGSYKKNSVPLKDLCYTILCNVIYNTELWSKDLTAEPEYKLYLINSKKWLNRDIYCILKYRMNRYRYRHKKHCLINWTGLNIINFDSAYLKS